MDRYHQFVKDALAADKAITQAPMCTARVTCIAGWSVWGATAWRLNDRTPGANNPVTRRIYAAARIAAGAANSSSM